MKNRSFMSGLGIGLIIGAILLQLMIMREGKDSPISDQSAVLTREQIKENAKALDLKVTESSEQLLTEEEWQKQKLEESTKDNGKSTEVPTKAKPAREPVKPSSPAQPVKKDESDSSYVQSPQIQSTLPTKPPVAPSDTNDAQAVAYKIKKGSNLKTVAEDLEKIGVITSSDQFIKQAGDQKINRKIRDGSYTFYKGENIESIISKIRIQSSR